MKYTALIALLAVALTLDCTERGFQDYIVKFSKNYADENQRTVRLTYYISNCTEIEAQNAKNLGYVLDVNQFTDRSAQELPQFNRPPLFSGQIFLKASASASNNDDIIVGASPESFNWGQYCAVTPAKNQGSCGSCWAFSTAAAAESFIKIQNTTEYDLSEEYLLECTQGSTCDGGIPSDAMTIMANQGAQLEADYPYKASSLTKGKPTTTGICNNAKIILPPSTTVKNYVDISDQQLKTILLESPVVVYFWNYKTFMSYKSGVFSCPRAPTNDELNHGVLIIGYDRNGDYLVKNSWGSTWGTYGFGTVSKSADCGIKRQLAQFTNGNTVNAMSSQNCSIYNTNFDTNGYIFEPNLIVKMLLLVMLLTII